MSPSSVCIRLVAGYGDEVENGVPIVALIKSQLLIREVSWYGAAFQSLVKQGSPPLKAISML